MTGKISDMTLGAALDGTENLEMVQAGATLRVLVSMIVTFVLASLSNVYNQQTGTTYTPVANDINKGQGDRVIGLDNASAITLTIPSDADLTETAVGDYFTFLQIGAGDVTVSPDSGVTFIPSGSLATTGAGSSGCAFKIAADTWVIILGAPAT